MSHELRTPLNAIIGFSEAALTKMFGPLDGKYEEYTEDILASGKHLLQLINDILDMSRIESGMLDLDEGIVGVGNVVGEALRLVRPQADKAGIGIREEIPSSLPSLIADDRRVKQMLFNLLSNAVKFTPMEGEIAVAAEHGENGISISIRDTGVGMTAEEIATALEPFGQVESALSRQHDGTGLGLPLTRRLMEEHGGRLDIRSEKGAGTTVILIFPPERLASR